MSTSKASDPRYSQARFAALARLRTLHAGTYSRLLAQEQASLGLRPARPAHRGRAYATVREQLRRLHPEEFRTLHDKELGKEPATTSSETKRRQRDRARARALSQLQQLHWDESRRLLDKERGRS